MSGGVQPGLLSGQDVKKTPLQMQEFDFYAAALRLPIHQSVQGDARDLPTAIATLEALFHDPAIGNEARESFRSLTIRTTDAAGAEVLRATMLRFWDSNDPEPIKLGLATVYRVKKFGIDFAKPYVARYLDSDDTEVMKAAVSALYAFVKAEIGSPIVEEEPDLEFAKGSLGNIVLSERVAAYGEEYGSLLGAMAHIPGGFPQEMRDKALEQLRTRHDLTSARIVALLGIVARGDQNGRQVAVDWIFGLQGEPFEAVVKAVSADAEVLVPGFSIEFWTEPEIEELVRRAAGVPDDRLVDYLRSFRHQTSFREHRGDVQDLVEERIEQLSQIANVDKSMLRNMKDFAKNLDR
jgi:hypothetical protein